MNERKRWREKRETRERKRNEWGKGEGKKEAGGEKRKLRGRKGKRKR